MYPLKKKSQQVFFGNIWVCSKKHQINIGKSRLFPIALKGFPSAFQFLFE